MNLSKWDERKVHIWIYAIAAAIIVVFFGFSLIFAHSRVALLCYSSLLATPSICIFFGVYQYRRKHPLRLKLDESESMLIAMWPTMVMLVIGFIGTDIIKSHVSEFGHWEKNLVTSTYLSAICAFLLVLLIRHKKPAGTTTS